MKKYIKEIIKTLIVALIVSTITVGAMFYATASEISFSSDKTTKTNVNDSLDELYDMAGKSECGEGEICLGSLETTNSTKKCRRAKSLHTEVCMRTDTTWYCSSPDTNYNGSEIKNKDTIIYGNTTIKKGKLNAGDAFTCDVNGDGIYNEETERFYYVSDLYTGGETGSETFDTNYAVLIYYNNTKDGEPNNTTAIAYDSNRYNTVYENNHGPIDAIANLPSTSQWSNIRLKTQTRQIRTEKGTTSTTAGTISSFTYTNKAARLLTAQEINKSCGITIGSRKRGELDTSTCRYLLENTGYSNPGISLWGYWLETPTAISSSYSVYFVERSARHVSNHVVGSASDCSVRPAIEVLKSDIAY